MFAKTVKIFANCKTSLILNPCAKFLKRFFLRPITFSLCSCRSEKTIDFEKFKLQNTRQQPKNFEMKSCRAAEFSKFGKLSMERKAGRASIAGGCLEGSLTGVLGSENPLPSSIVIEFSKDPSSSHGKNFVHSFRHISG